LGANHNRVFGMMFREIGSKHNTAGIGYAGVVLANSSDNEVRNNHFEYLEEPAARR